MTNPIIRTAAAACLLALACGDSGPAGPGAPASVVFAVSSATVALRGELQLSPVIRDDEGRTIAGAGSLAWESSNPEVASVDAHGAVTGHALGGPVAIRALAGTAEGAVQITVVPAAVSITPGVSSLAVGLTVPLELSAVDALGGAVPVGTVAWSSDVPAVATVDASTGLLTAVSTGTTTIRATADGFSANAGLYVGVPRTYDGEFVSTDTPNFNVRMTIFLGRVTGFTADYRPSQECRFEFGATPNFEIASTNFTFQLSNWASSVAATLVSDSVVTGGIGSIPAAQLSPGCLVWFGLSNAQNLSSRNVSGPAFVVRRP